MASKYPSIFIFKAGVADGNASMNMLLGGKGAHLAEMCQMGLPVPPGFTINTDVCKKLAACNGVAFLKEFEFLMHEVGIADAALQKELGYTPLVSVRSGAPVSMPGMMDTILNVGLCDENMVEWQKRIGVRAAWDSYRRLIESLSTTALGVPKEKMVFQLERVKKEAGVVEDTELGVHHLQILCSRMEQVVQEETKADFPATRQAQLKDAIQAVFDSWNSPRAIAYRKINNISADIGTACTVQTMVFGNTGESSGTGVLFTCNPSTGDEELMGEFLPNAQGEDVVAGIRTPFDIHKMEGLGGSWVDVYAEIGMLIEKLEAHYRDMMDVEFTVDKGKLWILQCRVGKRSALAAFRLAYAFKTTCDLSFEQALSRLTAEQFKLVRRPVIAASFKEPPYIKGIGASPGVAVGRAVFSWEEAVKRGATEPVILVTKETTPDDIEGMHAAVGILTQTGGATCHAAVVARDMEKPCVVGCTELQIHSLLIQADTGSAAPIITIDGLSGNVWLNTNVLVEDGSSDPRVIEIMKWAMHLSGFSINKELHEAPECDFVNQYSFAANWSDQKAVDTLAAVLNSTPENLDNVVVDLSSPFTHIAQDDGILANAFGDREYTPSEIANRSAGALSSLLLTIDKPGLNIIMPTATAYDKNILISKKWHLAGTPKTVSDIMHGGRAC